MESEELTSKILLESVLECTDFVVNEVPNLYSAVIERLKQDDEVFFMNFVEDDDGQDVEVELDSAVSMNMWGLHPKFIEVLDKGFEVFLEKLPESDIKKEYLLPRIIDRMLKSGEATVEVIRTDDKWFGVTYQEDKQIVIDSIRELISNGVYKEKLFS